MLECFPVLGVRLFERPTQVFAEAGRKYLYIKAKGVTATGYESGDGFVICENSQAVINEAQSLREGIREDRQNLLVQGVLKEDNGVYVFTQDYFISSPSNASSLILGAPTSGAQYWKNEAGLSLREIRETESKT